LDSANSKPSIPLPGVYGTYAVEPILLKSGITGITPAALANVENASVEGACLAALGSEVEAASGFSFHSVL
jgi:hypothetical protein